MEPVVLDVPHGALMTGLDRMLPGAVVLALALLLHALT